MDDILKQALESFGIAPQMYALLGALGILNAALKSSVSKWQRVHSLILGGIFGTAFGVALWIQNSLLPFEGLTKVVTLIAAAVLVEFGVELLPGFRNNANVKPSVPPTNNQGGYMRCQPLALFAGLLLIALTFGLAKAEDQPGVFGLNLAANGVWFDGNDTAFPADAELGLQARASLSPHLAAVGSGMYGLTHAYARYTVGARVTATDVADPNFSVGFGIQYHGYSLTEMRPNEWAPDASVGWKPLPADHPRLTLIGQGWYGLKAHRGAGMLGLRWNLIKQHKEVSQ